MRFYRILLLALPALLLAGIASAAPDPGRPPMLTPYPPSGEPTKLPAKAERANDFPAVSLFGMNLYLTGLERRYPNEQNTLAPLAAQAGVKWSREELSWANIEPNSKGDFAWGAYDNRLAIAAANNIDVIGMLLTTPRWASSNPTAGDYFWYKPTNTHDYYDFVHAAVSRWKDQIHTWEIWNEPNHQATWNCLNNCNRAAAYADLLAQGYAAVKDADPTARVLIGGLYVHDRTNEGFAFLDQVVAAAGGAINFDGLSIHTFMPDRIPESTDPTTVVQNFQYRLNLAKEWIDAHGGHPAEIWVTEDGRSTCSTCDPAFRFSEDDQASILARMYGIAAASPYVKQLDWFQFEDKFHNASNTDPADLYGNMAIVRNDFSTKPAYDAYKTAQGMLDGATYVGQGPAMVAAPGNQQPASSNFVGFDYRFTRGDQMIDMVWRVDGTTTIQYPLNGQQANLIFRDGGNMPITASNGHFSLEIGPKPQYIVQGIAPACTPRFSDVPCDYFAYNYVEYIAQRGIISGYADGTFRPANSATRAQLAKMIVVARGWQIVTPTTPSFVDVSPNNPFYGFIETAREQGAISGYADGTFRPGNDVTRGQISKIVVNAFGWPADTTGGPHFSDVATNNPFYAPIETARARGIISGYADGTFRPGNNATRAQLAKILYGALTQ